MLKAYCLRGGALQDILVTGDGPVPEDAIWLDLVSPAEGEDKLVEQALHIPVPTREEMVEIEPSSRLYVEDGARFMTGSVLLLRRERAPHHRRGELHPRPRQAGDGAL